MTRSLLGVLVAATFAHAGTSGACGLDDCTLATSLHQVHPDAPLQADAYAWMNHDLAVARDAVRRGDRAEALDLVATLDRALRAQLDHVVAVRGTSGALAIHLVLQDVSRAAGGFALEPLDLPGARPTVLARN